MSNDDHRTDVEILQQHFENPAKTGCIWRITSHGSRPLDGPHSGKNGSATFCCNHRHNGYSACSNSSRSVYHSPHYYERLPKHGAPDYQRYQEKHDVAQERARKGREKSLSANASESAKKRKAWATRWTSWSWWERYYVAAYEDPLYRLRVNCENAWEVGRIAPKVHLDDPKYLGKAGERYVKGGRVVMDGPPPANHADESVPGSLGMTYPYPHNYHHIIPIGAIKSLLHDPPPAGVDVTPLLRTLVIVESGWNINCEENVLILPTDVTIARVVELPAHAPWGARHHQKYSRIARQQIEKVARTIDEAFSARPANKHKAAKRAAKKAKALLENASRDLYTRIIGAAFGAQL